MLFCCLFKNDKYHSLNLLRFSFMMVFEVEINILVLIFVYSYFIVIELRQGLLDASK